MQMRKTGLYRWMFAGVAALFCGLGTAWAEDSQLDVVLKRGKIVVGTYSNSPPMAYTDEGGNLVGFEIDMAHSIAKALFGDESKVEFVVLQSAGRFPAVLSGKIDFGLCTTTITPDRAARISFTYPYIDAGNTLLARKDAGVTKIQDFNDSKYTYAVLNVPPDIAHAKEILPKANLLTLESPSDLFLAVKTGRATMFDIDKPIADHYAAENPDLVRVDTTGTPLSFVSQDAIFLKPGDFKWWNFLDTYVRELRFGTGYSDYGAWYRKWLKREPPPQRPWDPQKY